jgi:Domain of unknown function (DUF5658)
MKKMAFALGQNRVRRVAEALVILWLLGVADLLFTIQAFRSPDFFYEMNPLARTVLASMGIAGVIALKVVLLGIGASIFWRLRRHAQAEMAVWGLVVVHVLLIVQWSQYTAITTLFMQ